ncbi:MAG: hypothetical protein ACK5N8_03465, partial [Alphaproteobacteria bacterium]
MGNITGDFIENEIDNKKGQASGGLIYNVGSTIGNITGNFYKNKVDSEVYVGLINNDNGTIGNITGDFIENEIISEGGASINGALIYNTKTIGNIKGNFIKNKVDSKMMSELVKNTGNIESLVGDFVGNEVVASNAPTEGGMINNLGTITQGIQSNFYRNKISGYMSDGGILRNSGSNLKVTGDFVENDVSSTVAPIFGGIIYDISGSSSIYGSFVANKIASTTMVQGGIINAQGFSVLEGDFINNTISSTGTLSLWGGVIYNLGNISNLKGNFIGNDTYFNYTGAIEAFAGGGAIYNSNRTINLTGSFINNILRIDYASGVDAGLSGAAIANEGIINLSTTSAQKAIVFENNKLIMKEGNNAAISKLNSIDFISATSVLNINTIENSYVNIRDPMRSVDQGGKLYDATTGNRFDFGTINKSGAGSLYLWGDNSEYEGDFNVNGGTFYAMFEDKQDLVNDPLGQRLSFDLSNAVVLFADGTIFKPKVTNGQIANIGNS